MRSSAEKSRRSRAAGSRNLRRRSYDLKTTITRKKALTAAFGALGGKQATKGVDDVTLAQFRDGLASRIAEIQSLIRTDTYTFSALKPVAVPKKNPGTFRPILVPTVRDRLVQRAILGVISKPVTKHTTYAGSHAFTHERGVGTAVRALRSQLLLGRHIVLSVDIENFFPSVDTERLFTELSAVLPDQSLTPLLAQLRDWRLASTAHMSEKRRECFPASGCGLPQGSPLSPLLSNFYLREADKEALARGLCMIRYADDIVIPTSSRAEAEAAYTWLAERLEQLGLTIPPLGAPKSQIINVASRGNPGIQFLGFFLVPRGGAIHVKPSSDSVQKARAMIAEIMSPEATDNLAARYEALGFYLHGWLGTYGCVCAVSDLRDELLSYAQGQLELLLRARGILGENQMTPTQARFLGVHSLFEK